MQYGYEDYVRGWWMKNLSYYFLKTISWCVHSYMGGIVWFWACPTDTPVFVLRQRGALCGVYVPAGGDGLCWRKAPYLEHDEWRMSPHYARQQPKRSHHLSHRHWQPVSRVLKLLKLFIFTLRFCLPMLQGWTRIRRASMPARYN